MDDKERLTSFEKFKIAGSRISKAAIIQVEELVSCVHSNIIKIYKDCKENESMISNEYNCNGLWKVTMQSEQGFKIIRER